MTITKKTKGNLKAFAKELTQLVKESDESSLKLASEQITLNLDFIKKACAARAKQGYFYVSIPWRKIGFATAYEARHGAKYLSSIGLRSQSNSDCILVTWS